MLSLLCVLDSFLQTGSKVKFRKNLPSLIRSVGQAEFSLHARAEQRGHGGKGCCVAVSTSGGDSRQLLLSLGCGKLEDSHVAACCRGLASRSKQGRHVGLRKGAGHKLLVR